MCVSAMRAFAWMLAKHVWQLTFFACMRADVPNTASHINCMYAIIIDFDPCLMIQNDYIVNANYSVRRKIREPREHYRAPVVECVHNICSRNNNNNAFGAFALTCAVIRTVKNQQTVIWWPIVMYVAVGCRCVTVGDYVQNVEFSTIVHVNYDYLDFIIQTGEYCEISMCKYVSEMWGTLIRSMHHTLSAALNMPTIWKKGAIHLECMSRYLIIRFNYVRFCLVSYCFSATIVYLSVPAQRHIPHSKHIWRKKYQLNRVSAFECIRTKYICA